MLFRFRRDYFGLIRSWYEKRAGAFRDSSSDVSFCAFCFRSSVKSACDSRPPSSFDDVDLIVATHQRATSND